MSEHNRITNQFIREYEDKIHDDQSRKIYNQSISSMRTKLRHISLPEYEGILYTLVKQGHNITRTSSQIFFGVGCPSELLWIARPGLVVKPTLKPFDITIFVPEGVDIFVEDPGHGQVVYLDGREQTINELLYYDQGL